MLIAINLIKLDIDINAAATYVIAAALNTFFAPFTSFPYNILLFSNIFIALDEALNSTGNVINWYTTAAVKNTIPKVVNAGILKSNPA